MIKQNEKKGDKSNLAGNSILNIKMQNTGMLEQNIRIWYFLNLHLQNASSSEIAF